MCTNDYSLRLACTWSLIWCVYRNTEEAELFLDSLEKQLICTNLKVTRWLLLLMMMWWCWSISTYGSIHYCCGTEPHQAKSPELHKLLAFSQLFLSPNLFFFRYSEDNAAVRIKLITFLLRLAKRCSQQTMALPLFEDFFSAFTLCLVHQVNLMSMLCHFFPGIYFY